MVISVRGENLVAKTTAWLADCVKVSVQTFESELSGVRIGREGSARDVRGSCRALCLVLAWGRLNPPARGGAGRLAGAFSISSRLESCLPASVPTAPLSCGLFHLVYSVELHSLWDSVPTVNLSWSLLPSGFCSHRQLYCGPFYLRDSAPTAARPLVRLCRLFNPGSWRPVWRSKILQVEQSNMVLYWSHMHIQIFWD